MKKLTNCNLVLLVSLSILFMGQGFALNARNVCGVVDKKENMQILADLSRLIGIGIDYKKTKTISICVEKVKKGDSDFALTIEKNKCPKNLKKSLVLHEKSPPKKHCFYKMN